MAGIREQKKAETRKAITESAVQLFTEKGFEKTSIEDIAREAGIGKATVYTYFSTKDEIFMSFCDEEMADSFARLQSSDRAGVKLLDQLLEFFMIKFTFITRDNEFGRQLLRDMVFPKAINEKAKEHDQRYFNILEELFRSAQQRGEVSDQDDLFLLSVHFFSLYLGLLAGWYTGYVSTLEEVEDKMRVLFLQTLEGVAI